MADYSPLKALKDLAISAEEASGGPRVVQVNFDRWGITIRASDRFPSGPILQNQVLVSWDVIEDPIAPKILNKNLSLLCEELDHDNRRPLPYR